MQLGADITASGSFAISGVSSGAGNAIYNGALNVPAGKFVVLDLKSYKINRGLCTVSDVSANSGGRDNGHVLTIFGNLVLDGESDVDSSVNPIGGMIMGGATSGTVGGGGVFVANSATFTMNGGNICYNKSRVAVDYTGGGGGVYSSGKFVMNGGNICHNYANNGTCDGGGVEIGTFDGDRKSVV